MRTKFIGDLALAAPSGVGSHADWSSLFVPWGPSLRRFRSKSEPLRPRPSEDVPLGVELRDGAPDLQAVTRRGFIRPVASALLDETRSQRFADGSGHRVGPELSFAAELLLARGRPRTQHVPLGAIVSSEIGRKDTIAPAKVPNPPRDKEH
jgi:hypothetical protein